MSANRRQTVFVVSPRAFPINEDEVLQNDVQETDIFPKKLIKKKSRDSGALLAKYKNRLSKLGKRSSLTCSVCDTIQRFRNKEPVGLATQKFRRTYPMLELNCKNETSAHSKIKSTSYLLPLFC